MEPPLDDNARRLLAVIDDLSVRLPERERVVAALDMVATTEWTRVRIALAQESVDALLRPRSVTSTEVSEILDVARTAARLYGFEHIGVGLVAVAFVVTARWSEQRDPTDIDVVSEAFGLGHLENSAEILNQHLLARENPGSAPEGSGSAVGMAWGPTAAGARRRALARLTSWGARTAGFVLLVLAAAQHGGWHALVAWLVAFAAIPSSWDPRRGQLRMADDLHEGEIPLKWPWHACLAVAAGVVGLKDTSMVLTVLYLLLPWIGRWGEAGEARHLSLEGPELRAVGRRTSTVQAVMEGYAVRCRIRHQAVVLALAAVPAGLLAVFSGTAWPVYVLTAVFAAERLTGLAAVVSAIALGVGAVPWVLGAAAALGLVARAAAAWERRPPVARVPVDRPPLSRLLTSDGRVVFTALRLLHKGLPAAALRELDRLAEGTCRPEAVLLRGWALLEHGRPGEARRAVGVPDLEPNGSAALITCLAALDLADADAAQAALRRLDRSPDDWSRRRHLDLWIARARYVLLSDAAPEWAIETIVTQIPERITSRDVTAAAALMRLAAEAALPTLPALAVMLARTGQCVVDPGRLESTYKDFGLAGRGRVLALEGTRCAAMSSLAELAAAEEIDSDTVSVLGATEGAAGFLMRLDRPIEAATYLNALADLLEAAPLHRLAALDSRIEALAVLNATRHELRDADERRRWWTVFGRAAVRAMAQSVAGADWETLAELIESARLQLGPGADGDAFDALHADAPFIRVRGGSRMEQALWYRTDRPNRVFALEDMAEIALGPGTWWWSTWVHEETVFWSLVPPSGPVSGGSFSIAPTTEPAGALADLRDALPTPYPGEDGASWEARVLNSPLLVGPARTESSLASRLGSLLPPPLARALLDTEGRMRLAVAPAAELGHVPWPVVGILGDRQDARLVERCTAVLVPPAGLLARLADRPRPGDAPPLALAVIDPGGDLPGVAEEDRLPAARQLLPLLPEHVRTIAPDTDMSLGAFAGRLREIASETTALFACHVGADGDSSARGIVLRPRGEEPASAPALVLTSDLLVSAPRRFPMPQQVVMLACDSGDVTNAAAGEWLVLGPALLWAGAARVVVTSYPVLDTAEEEDSASGTGADGGAGNVIDRQLLAAVIDRRPLIDALHDIQRAQLARWRATCSQGAPVHWGGHLAMGAYGTLGTPRSLAPPVRCQVQDGVLELLDKAAENATNAGRHALTRWDVLLLLGLYGFDTPGALRRFAGKAALYGYALVAEGRRIVRRRLHHVVGTAVPDEEVMELLRATAAVTRTARDQVVHVEHLLAAFLGGPGAPAAAARGIFGLDGRRPEVVKEIIGDTGTGYQHTGLPELRHLDATAVPAVYEALEAAVPGPDAAARWHVADRKRAGGSPGPPFSS
ncbi:CHAT domain-containing protein [Streptomyces sp. NPDC093223]|uniref:CHAT domain-containing protein n=1 Tax=Streptomyces sp. NPDC093223 TaxID=3366033 RepID=UPI00382C0313